MNNLNSVLIYLDDNNNIVSQELATHVIIRETDDNGTLVKETHMVRKRDIQNKEPEKLELSQRDMDFIKSFGLNTDPEEINVKKK